jgi:hypothetical protein
MEVEMRKVFFLALLISLGIAFLGSAVNAQTPSLGFITSGSCLNSTSNFDSNLQPTTRDTAWTSTFAAVGSAIVSDDDPPISNVTEAGEYTISWPGSLGVPSAGSFTSTHTDTLSENPDGSGSFILQIGKITETYTAGPQAGLTATITFSDPLTLKEWLGGPTIAAIGKDKARVHMNTFVAGSNPPPVIETVILSNNKGSWYRICVRSVVVTRLPKG